MQVYASLEYGHNSLENAQACLNLSQYYFDRKTNFLSQAKFHALNARQILEELNIEPDNDDLKQNLIAYHSYLLLVKCSINAISYLSKREIKKKNETTLSIDTTHVDHDLDVIKKYLAKLKYLMKKENYEHIHMEYLFVKFNKIVTHAEGYDESIRELIGQIESYIERYNSDEDIKRKIDFYLRSGFYLIAYDESINDGFKCYRKAVQLAHEQKKIKPSIAHQYQLANAILQLNIAKVSKNHLTGKD